LNITDKTTTDVRRSLGQKAGEGGEGGEGKQEGEGKVREGRDPQKCEKQKLI